MSPRRNRRTPAQGVADPESGRRKVEAIEDGPDGEQWYVRHIPGTSATKVYRCPGCDQEIVPGTPHVVAWPADGARMPGGMALDERRHWHTACWQNRLRRGPGVKRRGVP
jgi:hypothetical protein